jgi:hypothetical protein
LRSLAWFRHCWRAAPEDEGGEVARTRNAAYQTQNAKALAETLALFPLSEDLCAISSPPSVRLGGLDSSAAAAAASGSASVTAAAVVAAQYFNSSEDASALHVTALHADDAGSSFLCRYAGGGVGDLFAQFEACLRLIGNGNEDESEPGHEAENHLPLPRLIGLFSGLLEVLARPNTDAAGGLLPRLSAAARPAGAAASSSGPDDASGPKRGKGSKSTGLKKSGNSSFMTYDAYSVTDEDPLLDLVVVRCWKKVQDYSNLAGALSEAVQQLAPEVLLLLAESMLSVLHRHASAKGSGAGTVGASVLPSDVSCALQCLPVLLQLVLLGPGRDTGTDTGTDAGQQQLLAFWERFPDTSLQVRSVWVALFASTVWTLPSEVYAFSVGELQLTTASLGAVPRAASGGMSGAVAGPGSADAAWRDRQKKLLSIIKKLLGTFSLSDSPHLLGSNSDADANLGTTTTAIVVVHLPHVGSSQWRRVDATACDVLLTAQQYDLEMKALLNCYAVTPQWVGTFLQKVRRLDEDSCGAGGGGDAKESQKGGGIDNHAQSFANLVRLLQYRVEARQFGGSSSSVGALANGSSGTGGNSSGSSPRGNGATALPALSVASLFEGRDAVSVQELLMWTCSAVGDVSLSLQAAHAVMVSFLAPSVSAPLGEAAASGPAAGPAAGPAGWTEEQWGAVESFLQLVSDTNLTLANTSLFCQSRSATNSAVSESMKTAVHDMYTTLSKLLLLAADSFSVAHAALQRLSQKTMCHCMCIAREISWMALPDSFLNCTIQIVLRVSDTVCSWSEERISLSATVEFATTLWSYLCDIAVGRGKAVTATTLSVTAWQYFVQAVVSTWDVFDSVVDLPMQLRCSLLSVFMELISCCPEVKSPRAASSNADSDTGDAQSDAGSDARCCPILSSETRARLLLDCHTEILDRSIYAHAPASSSGDLLRPKATPTAKAGARKGGASCSGASRPQLCATSGLDIGLQLASCFEDLLGLSSETGGGFEESTGVSSTGTQASVAAGTNAREIALSLGQIYNYSYGFPLVAVDLEEAIIDTEAFAAGAGARFAARGAADTAAAVSFLLKLFGLTQQCQRGGWVGKAELRASLLQLIRVPAFQRATYATECSQVLFNYLFAPSYGPATVAASSSSSSSSLSSSAVREAADKAKDDYDSTMQCMLQSLRASMSREQSSGRTAYGALGSKAARSLLQLGLSSNENYSAVADSLRDLDVDLDVDVGGENYGRGPAAAVAASLSSLSAECDTGVFFLDVKNSLAAELCLLDLSFVPFRYSSWVTLLRKVNEAFNSVLDELQRQCLVSKLPQECFAVEFPAHASAAHPGPPSCLRALLAASSSTSTSTSGPAETGSAESALLETGQHNNNNNSYSNHNSCKVSIWACTSTVSAGELNAFLDSAVVQLETATGQSLSQLFAHSLAWSTFLNMPAATLAVRGKQQQQPHGSNGVSGVEACYQVHLRKLANLLAFRNSLLRLSQQIGTFMQMTFSGPYGAGAAEADDASQAMVAAEECALVLSNASLCYGRCPLSERVLRFRAQALYLQSQGTFYVFLVWLGWFSFVALNNFSIAYFLLFRQLLLRRSLRPDHG